MAVMALISHVSKRAMAKEEFMRIMCALMDGPVESTYCCDAMNAD